MSTDRSVQQPPNLHSNVDLSAVGRSLADEVRWASQDSILYALAVGAGPSDPQFTTDNTHGVEQRAVPTLATCLGGSLDREVIQQVGAVDWSTAVEIDHRVDIYQPIEVSGWAVNEKRIAAIYDTGRSAIVAIESVSRDGCSNEILFENHSSVLLRGQGGFGGDRPETQCELDPPTREPDEVIQDRSLPVQAHLFRLTGDDNPLHTCPDLARRAGFSGSILQGLCTMGFSCRALIAGGLDPHALRSMKVRFLAPAYPGDPLDTEIWHDGGMIRLRTVSSAGPVIVGWATEKALSERTCQP